MSSYRNEHGVGKTLHWSEAPREHVLVNFFVESFTGISIHEEFDFVLIEISQLSQLQ